MNGTLYRLVVVLRVHNWQSASYEQINNLLEKEGLAGGIDLMITRNADVADIDTINVDEICKSSLAYKLGSENDRAMLTKVFEARYSRISSLADEDDYGVFLETGLSLSEFKQLRESFTDDDVQQFEGFNEAEQEVFMTYLVARLKEIGFVDEDLDVDSFVQVAILFMKGATYVEIANNRKISVDEVLRMTNYLQNGFADCVRSVTAYVVNKYAVENSYLECWADYLKYGIWTGYQYELVTKRLSDHIAVHGMSRFVNEVMQSDWADTSYLKLNMDSVLSYFYEKGYPKLTRERVERWLKA
ncbi:MAG: hypothetical protein MJZ56_03450 [Bacteroidales bacterium]|nr:hypothetical protein [Bacteroidales bacterium]